MKNKNIQTEIDAAFLYQKLADHEKDPTIASVFSQMSAIEKSHAEAFAKKENHQSGKPDATFLEGKDVE